MFLGVLFRKFLIFGQKFWLLNKILIFWPQSLISVHNFNFVSKNIVKNAVKNTVKKTFCETYVKRLKINCSRFQFRAHKCQKILTKSKTATPSSIMAKVSWLSLVSINDISPPVSPMSKNFLYFFVDKIDEKKYFLTRGTRAKNVTKKSEFYRSYFYLSLVVKFGVTWVLCSGDLRFLSETF